MMVLIPKYDDFMLPTLRVLYQLGGSASNEELQDSISAMLHLTQDQLDASYATSGLAIAPDRMTWARSYLKIAGLVASGGRAIWILTDNGREAVEWSDATLKRFVADKFNVHEKRRRKEREARKSVSQVIETVAPFEFLEIGQGAVRQQNDIVLPSQIAKSEFVASDVATENESNWQDALLSALKSIDPAAFERLCQRLLRESGFVKVEVTGKSGDGGIDGVGVLRMNLISFQVLFQCKRYAGSVSSPTVRDFRGAMQGRADKGLIITTGTFTADARREATRDGAPAIDLVDGELLCELLKDKRLGVSVREVRTEEVTVDAAFLASV